MKQLIAFTFFITLSHADWSVQTKAQGLTTAVACSDGNTCFAITGTKTAPSSSVIVLKPGGTWHPIYYLPSFNNPVKTQGALRAIAFRTHDSAYAVGDSGRAYSIAVKDTIADYRKDSTGTAQSLYSVVFPTPAIGYAIGGPANTSVVVKTMNGGASWKILPVYPVNATSISCIGPDTCFIPGHRTTDGGATWSSTTGTNTRSTVKFISGSIGYGLDSSSIARSMIYRTTDGGASVTASNATTQIGPLRGLAFFNQSIGYAVGTVQASAPNIAGGIETTTDGVNWTNDVPIGTYPTLRAICTAGNATAYAVGDSIILQLTRPAVSIHPFRHKNLSPSDDREFNFLGRKNTHEMFHVKLITTP